METQFCAELDKFIRVDCVWVVDKIPGKKNVEMWVKNMKYQAGIYSSHVCLYRGDG